MKFYNEPSEDQWATILQRSTGDSASVEKIVHDIIDDVKINGDKALRNYAKRFENADIGDLKVTASEIAEAGKNISADLKAAIQLAYVNIKTFHESQKEKVVKIETTKGVQCWRKSVAIEKVGLYIPGGTAPLLSTLLMLGIPATLAGCEKIVVCTPADKQGNVPDAILYVAELLNITDIFKTGGAQAIAAMAFGTESIPQVYKIFGPGNQYVTLAKQILQAGVVAIDMPAGPSELAVYADETANPEFVAADLLSQAEHGKDSHVVLVANSETILKQVEIAINDQLAILPRQEIASAALSNSLMLVINDRNKAFKLLNQYAAEHLIIATDDAEELSALVINAGSVFLGHYSPESAGDYASGTNHTLPTNGAALAYSGVSLESFFKKISFQQISAAGIQGLGPAVETLAEAEGLQAHKNAVSIRLKELNERI